MVNILTRDPRQIVKLPGTTWRRFGGGWAGTVRTHQRAQAFELLIEAGGFAFTQGNTVSPARAPEFFRISYADPDGLLAYLEYAPLPGEPAPWWRLYGRRRPGEGLPAGPWEPIGPARVDWLMAESPECQAAEARFGNMGWTQRPVFFWELEIGAIITGITGLTWNTANGVITADCDDCHNRVQTALLGQGFVHAGSGIYCQPVTGQQVTVVPQVPR